MVHSARNKKATRRRRSEKSIESNNEKCIIDSAWISLWNVFMFMTQHNVRLHIIIGFVNQCIYLFALTCRSQYYSSRTRISNQSESESESLSLSTSETSTSTSESLSESSSESLFLAGPLPPVGSCFGIPGNL